MEYNFTKLDLSQKLQISISSKIFEDFSKRCAIGVQFKTGSRSATWTERLEYETEQIDVFAIERAFQILKELIFNYEVFQREITIYTKFDFNAYINNPDLYMSYHLKTRLNMIRVDMHHYELMGFEFLFIEGSNADLENNIEETFNSYFIYNDFRNKVELLSIISSPQFDKDLYNQSLNQNIQMIQYVDKFSTLNISGPIKRILVPLDGAAQDSFIESIDTVEKYPSNNERKNFLIRRLALVISQADVALLFSTVDSNNTIISPDIWFYDLAKKKQIPFYFYNCESKFWYTISQGKSLERELIHIKNFNLPFKQIAYYVNTGYVKEALIEFRKILNKNFI